MRIEWLDSLKGFAIFLVVVGHVVLGYLRAGTFPEYQWSLQLTHDLIYSFHMPLFFLISGFLYKLTWSKKNTGILINIINKFLNLIPMYLLFSVVFWISKYYASLYGNIQMSDFFTFSDLMHIYIAPLSYLWFLYVLIWLFVFVPLFESLFKPLVIFITFLLLYLFLPPVEGIFKVVNSIIYGGVYFTLGSVIYTYYESIKNIISKNLLIVGLISILMASISFPYITDHTALKFVCALGASSFLAILFFKLKDRKLINFWNICGRYSLGIYILHLYFSGPLRTVFKNLSIDNIIVVIVLSCIISTIIPIFIVMFFDRFKITSWIFGNSKLIKFKA